MSRLLSFAKLALRCETGCDICRRIGGRWRVIRRRVSEFSLSLRLHGFSTIEANISWILSVCANGFRIGESGGTNKTDGRVFKYFPRIILC